MKHFYFVACIMLFFGCSQTSKENKAKIIGTWKTIEWKIDDTQRTRNQKLDFKFEESDRYSVDYGSELEKGKYWFEGNDLFTIEDGSAMKKVNIEFVTSDTMIMKMNRAGQRETVQLVKI